MSRGLGWRKGLKGGWGNVGWSKGLTKETHAGLASSAEKHRGNTWGKKGWFKKGIGPQREDAMTFEQYYGDCPPDREGSRESHKRWKDRKAVWIKAYIEGQEAMRERAARKAESLEYIPQHIPTGIRHLEPE